MHATYYILTDDGNVRQVSGYEVWTAWMVKAEQNGRCLTAEDWVGDSCIRTKFMGLKFSGEDTADALWETRVFGGILDGKSKSFAKTRQQAIEMHNEVLTAAKELQSSIKEKATNILVVEDDDFHRSYIRKVLTDADYPCNITEANDGNTALSLYKEQQTDIILTDILMPETDGITLIKELRESGDNVKILAFTSGGKIRESHNYLDIARIFGANATLHKPFTEEELNDKVAGLIHSILI